VRGAIVSLASHPDNLGTGGASVKRPTRTREKRLALRGLPCGSKGGNASVVPWPKPG
jgi:hypothetical protein